MCALKLVRAPTVMRDSIVRGPHIVETEQGTKVGAEEHNLNAMWWGPIQIFNWWSFLFGGGPANSPDKAAAAM